MAPTMSASRSQPGPRAGELVEVSAADPRPRPAPRPFFCLDLDGTLTTEEILPRIAAELGIGAQMAELTASAMAGDEPFEISLRRRTEMLRALPVSRVQEIVAGVPLDEPLLEFVRGHADRCAVVTGNLDVWIAPLLARIGVPFFCSTARVEGDRLLGLSRVLRKAAACASLPRPLVAVGDGNNDVEMLEAADVGIAYGGVHPPAESLLDVASHAIYSDLALCRFLRQLS